MFVVGDLSTVWLIANVRETDASQVAVGEMVRATVLAYPERVFTATLDYVGALAIHHPPASGACDGS